MILHHVTSLAYFYHCHCHCLYLYEWWTTKKQSLGYYLPSCDVCNCVMIQGTTGGVFTCVVTGDAVRCLYTRLCPPTGAGTTLAAVSTPLSLCSSVDSSSAGAGASGDYSIVVPCTVLQLPHPPPYYVATDIYLSTILTLIITLDVVKLREREGHRLDSGSHSKVIYRL